VAKKEQNNTKRFSLKLGKKKRSSSRRHRNWLKISLFAVLILLAAAVITAAVVTGFIFLEKKYVKKIVPVSTKTAFLELLDIPEWLNEPLKNKIYSAAKADGEDLKLDDDVARSVQRNIEKYVSWLADVKVQTTSDHLVISAKWRKPVALFESGPNRFYVDSDLVVLDYLPIPDLPIVTVTGISAVKNVPAEGGKWHKDDLAAAVDIIDRLVKMDKTVTPEKPLLHEIDSIDVSNFNGRQNSKQPHIILYTKDDTEIIWGAEFGKWQRYLEAADEEKLAKLYGYYKENGSLIGGVRYINLRSPQDKVLQPVDKY